MITIHTLASGSEGNAALVCAGDVHILVDAGISARRIETALRSLNRLPQALSAVFITHTHSDHTAGLRVLLKHTGRPRICLPRRVRRPAAADTGQRLSAAAPMPRGCTGLRPADRDGLCHIP